MSNPLMQAKMFADDLLSEYNPSKLSIVEAFFIKFLLAAAIVMVAFAYFDSTSSLNKTGVSAGQGENQGEASNGDTAPAETEGVTVASGVQRGTGHSRKV